MVEVHDQRPVYMEGQGSSLWGGDIGVITWMEGGNERRILKRQTRKKNRAPRWELAQVCETE